MNHSLPHNGLHPMSILFWICQLGVSNNSLGLCYFSVIANNDEIMANIATIPRHLHATRHHTKNSEHTDELQLHYSSKRLRVS